MHARCVYDSPHSVYLRMLQLMASLFEHGGGGGGGKKTKKKKKKKRNREKKKKR